MSAGTVPCPIGGCDYSAESPASVEAHISSKRDESHRGEVGQNYRDELEGSETSDGSSSGESSESVADDPPLDGESSEPAGVPMPALSTEQWIVGLALGAAALYVVFRLRSSSSSESTPKPQTGENTEESDDMDVDSDKKGLVG